MLLSKFCPNSPFSSFQIIDSPSSMEHTAYWYRNSTIIIIIIILKSYTHVGRIV